MKRNAVIHSGLSRREYLLGMLCAWALLAIASGCATTAPAAAPPPDENALSAAGFKVIVATTPKQQEHLQSLTPGKLSAMERNNVPYYVYPDAGRNRIYVGTQKEYQAYLKLHPDGNVNVASALTAQQAADQASYMKQDEAMRKADKRDLSDPFWFWPSFAALVW